MGGDPVSLKTGLVILGLLSGLGGVVPVEACSQAGRTSGECLSITGSVDSTGATLGATQTTPGTSGTSGSTSGSGSSTGATTPRPPWRPPPPRAPVLGSAQCSIIIAGSCRGQSPSKNPPRPVVSSQRQAPRAPSTVQDVASFAPGAPGIVVEPGTWSLPRLTTNIFSTAREQTQPGELLGWPVEVRFTPRAYRWSYGDGASATHASPGSSWGAAQFSPASTGHVYRAPGTYSISLQVDYAVAYRFDNGPFRPLSGTVSVTSGPARVQVLRVTPVLVDRGCAPGTLVEGRCE